jgi:hypothetical protein
VRLLGLSGIGALPGVSLGSELAGHVRSDWLVAELVAMGWLHNSSYVHLGAPARIDIGLRLVALRLGWGPQRTPLRAWLGGELGELSGEGVGLEDARIGSGRWMAVSTGFAVAWPMFTHARLVGTIEAAMPVERVPFALQGGSEIYRSGAVTVRSGLGLEVGWR